MKPSAFIVALLLVASPVTYAVKSRISRCQVAVLRQIIPSQRRAASELKALQAVREIEADQARAKVILDSLIENSELPPEVSRTYREGLEGIGISEEETRALARALPRLPIDPVVANEVVLHLRLARTLPARPRIRSIHALSLERTQSPLIRDHTRKISGFENRALRASLSKLDRQGVPREEAEVIARSAAREASLAFETRVLQCAARGKLSPEQAQAAKRFMAFKVLAEGVISAGANIWTNRLEEKDRRWFMNLGFDVVTAVFNAAFAGVLIPNQNLSVMAKSGADYLVSSIVNIPTSIAYGAAVQVTEKEAATRLEAILKEPGAAARLEKIRRSIQEQFPQEFERAFAAEIAEARTFSARDFEDPAKRALAIRALEQEIRDELGGHPLNVTGNLGADRYLAYRLWGLTTPIEVTVNLLIFNALCMGGKNALPKALAIQLAYTSLNAMGHTQFRERMIGQ